MKLKNMKRSEDTEQIQVFNWEKVSRQYYKQLKWLYHIANGGLRVKGEATKLKAMGVKAGVSDICFPFPHGVYHVLFVEMKYGDNKPTEKQLEFLQDMQEAGHFTAVCYSAQAAVEIIRSYMELKDGQTMDMDSIKQKCMKVQYNNEIPYVW